MSGTRHLRSNSHGVVVSPAAEIVPLASTRATSFGPGRRFCPPDGHREFGHRPLRRADDDEEWPQQPCELSRWTVRMQRRAAAIVVVRPCVRQLTYQTTPVLIINYDSKATVSVPLNRNMKISKATRQNNRVDKMHTAPITIRNAMFRGVCTK